MRKNQDSKNQDAGRIRIPESVLALSVLVLGSKYKDNRGRKQDSENQDVGRIFITESVLFLIVLVLGSKFENIMML